MPPPATRFSPRALMVLRDLSSTLAQCGMRPHFMVCMMSGSFFPLWVGALGRGGVCFAWPVGGLDSEGASGASAGAEPAGSAGAEEEEEGLELESEEDEGPASDGPPRPSSLLRITGTFVLGAILYRGTKSSSPSHSSTSRSFPSSLRISPLCSSNRVVFSSTFNLGSLVLDLRRV